MTITHCAMNVHNMKYGTQPSTEKENDMTTILILLGFSLSFYLFICLIVIQFNREQETHCFICDDVIDWDNDGVHIFADGSTMCPHCEYKYEEL